MNTSVLVRAHDPLTSVMAASRYRKPRVDLLGKRFGRLLVAAVEGSKGGQVIWRCKCDCGNTNLVSTRQLNSGQTSSCGCFGAERRTLGAKRANTTHARSKTALYKVWGGMIRRCEDAHHKSFKGYGARGISVCSRWHSFEAFRNDMGERPSPRHTIERVNNDGNYEPGNCRWATLQEQARNRRSARILTIFGESKSVIEWSEDSRCAVGYDAFSQRVCSGWAPEDALTRQLYSRLPELFRNGNARVVQFNGEDLIRDGYRVWERV